MSLSVRYTLYAQPRLKATLLQSLRNASSTAHSGRFMLLALWMLGSVGLKAQVTYGYATFPYAVTNVAGHDYLLGQKINVPVASLITHIGINMGDAENINMSIYSDNANAPGALLAQTGVLPFVAGQNLLPLTASINLPPGDYWVMETGGPTNFQFGAENTNANGSTLTYYQTHLYTDPLPANFGSGLTYIGGRASMYLYGVLSLPIWTGNVSTDWAVPGNWQNGTVPTATDDVIIPDVTNDPIILNGTAAVAKSVSVNTSASLTINTTGSLTINSDAHTLFANSGAVVNEGTISLHSTSPNVTFHRLFNKAGATFTNKNVLQMGNASNQTIRGITNLGSFVNMSGSITFASTNRAIYLVSGATFTNNASIVFNTGQNNVDSSAVTLFGGGTFNNTPCSATLLATAGSSSLVRFETFGGTFSNDGLITENSSGPSNITNNTGIVQNLGGGSFTITNNMGTLTTNPGPQNACCTPPACNITGADYVCDHSSGNTYTASPGMAGYNWSISGNGVIQGPTTGSSISVTAGNFFQDYTVFVTITNTNGCTSTCSKLSGIYLSTPPTNITINPSPACFGVTLNLSVPSAASSTVSWSGEGIGNSSGNPSTTALPTTTGLHTYGVTITTDYGCSNTGTANVNIYPLPAPPVITGPTAVCSGGSIVLDAGAGYAMYAWSSGGGSGQTASFSNILAPTTYTVTVTDGNGCTSTDSHSVTINAPPNPTITGPTTVCPGGSIMLDAGGGYATYAWSNSGGGSQTATFTNITAPTTYTVSVTDANSCTGTDTHTVTAIDNTPPTITCPAPIVKNADPGQCNAVTTYTVTASDNCVYTLTRTSPPATASGAAFPVGTTNVVWSVTDAGGNSTGCSFTVTVNDNQGPAITCPAPIVKNTDAGQCSAVVIYSVTASDNCSSTVTLTRTNGFASGTAFPTGVNVVNWQVTDAGGNSTACSFTVTVTDGQLPTIVCPGNISKTTDLNQCSAVTTYANPTFSDNCPGASLTRTSGQASGSAFPKGTTMVNWKATDASGNSSVCGFTVTVTDGQLPTITCPANIVKSADPGVCTAVVSYVNPIYSDNCTGAGLDHISGGLSGSTFPKGVASIVWQATDATNLTKRCTFTITVNDTQAPTITCPANQSKSTDAGLCTAVATYTTPTFTDNCAGGSVTLQTGLASGAAFPKGINTVTWKATDAGGLTKTCTFRITVNDAQAPTISCPANQAKTTDPNLCTAVATYNGATFTDNCPGGTMVQLSGLASGSAFPKGVNSVVFKATDAAGNQSLCTMTVTVTDAQLPAITCPANIAVTGSISNGVCSATVTYTNPTATDNCGILSNFLLSGLASGSVFPMGVTTNTWKATDTNGWTATCAFTVSVGCGTTSKTMNDELGTRNDELGTMNDDQRTRDDFGVVRSSFIVHRLSFNIAPNPATTGVLISMEGLDESGGELSIFDATGRMIWQQQITAEQPQTVIQLSDRWNAGMYWVTLRSSDRLVTKRLIKVE